MAPDPITTLLERLESFVDASVRHAMASPALAATTAKTVHVAKSNLYMALRDALAGTGRGSGSSQRMAAVHIRIDQEDDETPTMPAYMHVNERPSTVDALDAARRSTVNPVPPEERPTRVLCPHCASEYNYDLMVCPKCHRPTSDPR